MTKHHTIHRVLRVLGITLGVLGLGALGLLGWHWMAALHVERIAITGVQHADTSALLNLAQADTGLAMLHVEPRIVADRVRRHPWVETARVTRLPTGTLAIDVRERTPVVLVLDGRGRPSHFLDRDGFAMPVVAGAAYDVPLLRGLRESYHPVRPMQGATVRAILAALVAADASTDALISELELRAGDVWLHTTPAGQRGSIPVRLGHGDLHHKLATLRTFWHQAVLTQPDKTFKLIDLRFDSQIVTREDVGGS